LGERLLCKQEVIGSIPFTSTTLLGGQGERCHSSLHETRHEVPIRAGGACRLRRVSLIEWVKKRVYDVTEEDTSGTPVAKPQGWGTGSWSVSDMCLQERDLPHRRRMGSAAMQFWSLPLGVVLKRE
jgi:hypothetical protein